MQLITFKLEKKFLKKLDKTVGDFNFSNRTEFIRTALREKIQELRIRSAVLELKRKSLKRRELGRIEERLLKEIEEEFQGGH